MKKNSKKSNQLSKNYFEKHFYLGPMTKNVVDSVISFNNSNNYFGFIPSRRQIECKELGSGYVNGWSTHEFVNHANNTVILRDHAGPLQGLAEDDGLLSLSKDIDAGIKFLHIDPWKSVESINEAIEKTASLIMHASSIKECFFEIGTEEAIFKYTPAELNNFIIGVRSRIGNLFEKVIYCVVQSGTSVKALSNIGSFNKAVSSEMCDICHGFNLKAKEHNSDYLSIEDINKRINSGVDSLNIAPELGVIETNVILKRLENNDNLKSMFHEICYKSGKWKKWVDKTPDMHTISKISGHYTFNTLDFKNLKTKLGADLDEEIKFEINKKLEMLWNIKK